MLETVGPFHTAELNPYWEADIRLGGQEIPHLHPDTCSSHPHTACISSVSSQYTSDIE